ncbi:MAG: hypothetical protein CMP91_01695 [Gammaproteobacteria bacterium]|nr:hypothetical protein [Gammaproteobacteria bacterium]|tara:strand:+ start:11989 stop:13500 length:1512 start_codon:yes stop_codon:yes gene_type:complete
MMLSDSLNRLRLLALLGGLVISVASQAQNGLLLQPYEQDTSRQTEIPESGEADTGQGLGETLSSISLFEQAIELAELREGPYSFELAEQYMALGDQYQQLGRHEEAIVQYESAQYILRINNGLFGLDQETLLDKMTRSYVALGDEAMASSMQEYRYYLYQKNYAPESAEFADASLSMVDWYLESYLRDPENLSSFTSNGARSAPSIRNSIALYDTRLRRFYFLPRTQFRGFDLNVACVDSFNVMTTNPTLELDRSPNFQRAHEIMEFIDPENNPQLGPETRQQLLLRQAEIAYQSKMQLEYIASQVTTNPYSPFNCSTSYFLSLRGQEYGRGRDALESNIAYLSADPESSLEEIAEARLQLADFHLAFGYPGRAEELYYTVYSELSQAGLEAGLIDSIMNPAEPVFIPDFAVQPYSAAAWGYSLNEEIPYEGYIDVGLQRNSRGEFTEVDFQRNTGNVSQQMVEMLLRLLKSVNSRPSLDAGVPVESEQLSLRYYFARPAVQE